MCVCDFIDVSVVLNAKIIDEIINPFGSATRVKVFICGAELLVLLGLFVLAQLKEIVIFLARESVGNAFSLEIGLLCILYGRSRVYSVGTRLIIANVSISYLVQKGTSKKVYSIFNQRENLLRRGQHDKERKMIASSRCFTGFYIKITDQRRQ